MFSQQSLLKRPDYQQMRQVRIATMQKATSPKTDWSRMMIWAKARMPTKQTKGRKTPCSSLYLSASSWVMPLWILALTPPMASTTLRIN